MSGSRLRLAELLATLSLATEAGTTGSVADLGLKSAIFSVNLGVDIGLSEDGLRDAFYLALLQYIGCTGDADIAAAVMGDEVGFGGEFKGIDFGDPFVALTTLLGYVRRGKSVGGQIAVIMQTLLSMPKMAGLTRTHCELADRLAENLDVGARVRHGLTQVFERWNGKGMPNGVRGGAIDLPVRVVIVAETAVLAARLGGVDAMRTVLRERSGKAIDPKIATRAAAKGEQLLASLNVASTWGRNEGGAENRLSSRATSTMKTLSRRDRVAKEGRSRIFVTSGSAGDDGPLASSGSPRNDRSKSHYGRRTCMMPAVCRGAMDRTTAVARRRYLWVASGNARPPCSGGRRRLRHP